MVFLKKSLQALSYQRLHAAQLTGYRRNEFDTTKFTSGLAYRTQSQYDLPSFGMDPDAPVFLTGYGPGGLPSHSSHVPKRPDSALQVGKFEIKEETFFPRILLKIFYWFDSIKSINLWEVRV